MKLTNKEIVLANQAFQRLNAIKFPVRTAFLLVKAAATLDKLVEVIEKMRRQFIETHAQKEESGRLKPIEPGTPEMEDFNKDWVALLEEEQSVGEITPVKLPEKIASTCDKCHHNMDKPLEIEPDILKPLEKFIDMT